LNFGEFVFFLRTSVYRKEEPGASCLGSSQSGLVKLS
jgi:hypothetical protein